MVELRGLLCLKPLGGVDESLLVPWFWLGGFGGDVRLELLAGMFAAANQLFFQIIGLQQNYLYYSVL